MPTFRTLWRVVGCVPRFRLRCLSTAAPERETILSTPSSACGQAAWVSVAEAAIRLSLDRSRVYTLVRSGELQGTPDPVDGLRVDVARVQRRRALGGQLAGRPLDA